MASIFLRRPGSMAINSVCSVCHKRLADEREYVTHTSQTATMAAPAFYYYCVEHDPSRAVIVPDSRLSAADREQLENVIVGAYPTVRGEWTGEEWELHLDFTNNDPNSVYAFRKEIEYIRLWNKPGGATLDELKKVDASE